MATATPATTQADAAPDRLPPLDDDRLRRPAAIAPDAGDEPPLYRITADIYERMVASGVFGDTSPIYLWKGQLVLPPTMTKGPAHENALAFLNAWFIENAPRPKTWHVRPGSPVRVRDDSVPEPDLLIVRGAIRDYVGRTATAADVLMAIEVADTSLRIDAGTKLAVYAEAGLPIYWVVNIPRRRVDVYSSPSGPAETPSYADHRSYAPGDVIPVALDGHELGRIAVDDVLIV